MPTLTRVEKIRRLRLWINALRSGKYKQTRQTLHNKYDNTYCCLGVSCDIYRKHTKKGRWDGHIFVTSNMYRNSTELPLSVSRWFGLPDHNPELTEGVSCISANDNEKWSFKKIASAVEECYLKPLLAKGKK